jgi:hypothetical protein
MKICKTCNKLKPLIEYSKIHQGRYYQSSCKLCIAKKNIKWVSNHKEYVKARMKKWKENHKECDKKVRLKYPEKYKARFALNNFMRTGKIKKQNICEVCFKSPTECHHDDYSKPFEFIELCRKCHCLLHRKNIYD